MYIFKTLFCDICILILVIESMPLVYRMSRSCAYNGKYIMFLKENSFPRIKEIRYISGLKGLILF